MRTLIFSSTRSVVLLLMTTAVVFAWQGIAAAVDGTWGVDADGPYNTASNWQGSTIASGASSTANFAGINITGDRTVTLDTPLTIGSIVMGDTTPGDGSWAIMTTNLSVITLDNGASSPTLHVDNISSPLFNHMFIGNPLAGTAGFTKTGPGGLELGAGVTHTLTAGGGIRVNEGSLRMMSAIPNQSITIGNGASFTAGVTMDANTGNSFIVASGNTATIRTASTVELGNFNVSGATLNIVQEGAAGDTITADGDWAVGGSAAAMNISSVNGGFLRLRPNSGSPVFNTTNAFATTALNLDNITMWTRSNSGGNDVNIGALTGTSTAVIAGGAQGGGTTPRYIIGALNTDTTYAGSFDSSVALPAPQAGFHIVKVGTGKLTLSGTVNNVPRVGTAGIPPNPPTTTGAVTLPWRRGGVTQIQNGTIALVEDTVIAGGVVDDLANAGEMLTTIDVQANGTLDVTGYTAGTYGTQNLQQILGAGNIVGNWNHSTGFIRPGNAVPDLGGSGTITSTNTTPVAGTLTFNGNFTLGGGTINFDAAPAPGPGNDLVSVTGHTTITSGRITPNFLGAAPTSGTYTVLTSAGGITGNGANVVVDFPGRTPDGVAQVQGNSLVFNASDIAAGANLVWTGSPSGTWDIETTQNWTNGGSPDRFFTGDAVTFSEAAGNKTVTVSTAVQPESVTINSSSAYSFTGAGSIIGGATLTKTGSGNLTMQLSNTYSGATSLQGGTIDVGASGNPFGTGPLTVDGVSIVGTSTTGFGSSSMAATGAVSIQVAGTLGQGNQFTLPNLTGSGSLTFTTAVTDKWMQFNTTTGYTGTINLQGPDGGTPLHARILASSAFGVLNLNDTRVSQRNGTGGTTSTITIGELHGDDNTRLRAFEGGSPAVGANWLIGGANTNSDFAGVIEDGAGNNNTTSVSHVHKVGTGTLTLTGANTYTGNTTVEAGTLSINQGFLADTADVFLTTGGKFNLNFSGDDIIRYLYIDGVPQNPGLYGLSGLGSSFFLGTGRLSVSELGPVLGLTGDYNNDGSVDAADYTVWRNNLGQPGNTLMNRDPFNGTGVVAQIDYNSWKANFGAGNPGSGSLASVPEPAGWLVAMLALVACGVIRRR